MVTLLTILGLICIVGLPFYAILYIVPKVHPEDWKAGAPMLLLIPGFIILGIAFHLNREKPVIISQACATVQYYKQYSISRRHGGGRTYERIALQLDHSKYFRHFRFDESLARKNKGDHVCFEFHDRKKNSQLPESVILKWIDK